MMNKRPANKAAIAAVVAALAAVPVLGGANMHQSSVVGSTCLVPIFHTNFAFPPEGDYIVKFGNQMYFVQVYRSECANAGAGGEVLGSHPDTGINQHIAPNKTGQATSPPTTICPLP